MPDDKGYTLPLVAVRDLQEVKKRVLGSSVTRSRKFRRRRGGAAKGGGDVEMFVVTSRVDPASGTQQSIRPGLGVGKRYSTSTAHGSEGYRTPSGSEVLLANYDRFATFLPNSVVYAVKMVTLPDNSLGNFSETFEVVSGSCGALPPGS